ncbi:MAG: MBL fold metallo-hydrolase [Candidatus Zixiibacteriota bacterium]
MGPFEVNCYLYWDATTGDGVIIDPGAECETILKTIERCNMTSKGLLLTHGHGDHIGAVNEVMNRLSVPLYASVEELPLLSNPAANLSAFLGQAVSTQKPDHFVADEQLLVLGAIQLRVLSTPGHSPGGVSYLDETEGILFCGDALFQGSIGRTDLPGCSHETLIDSIQRKILALPDSVICYPGHGPFTTVGAERSSNPFLVGGYHA